MAKDYYLILGVPLDAAPDQIRSAFRKLARRYHPDRGGEPGARAFRDVSEAYGVLSDPVQRERYDRKTGRTTPLVSKPLPVSGEPESVRPSHEGLLDRLMRNFVEPGGPKAERAEPLTFELILSPREAARGVVVPFEIPVFSLCSDCAGTGRDWVFPCLTCDGEGRLVEPRPVEVNVPAGIRDGALIEVSLEPLGVHNLWLRVHVRIAPH